MNFRCRTAAIVVAMATALVAPCASADDTGTWPLAEQGISAGTMFWTADGAPSFEEIVSMSDSFEGLYIDRQPGADNAHLASHLSFVATPVPESDIYALLLAGLGVIAIVARRRQL